MTNRRVHAKQARCKPNANTYNAHTYPDTGSSCGNGEETRPYFPKSNAKHWLRKKTKMRC